MPTAQDPAGLHSCSTGTMESCPPTPLPGAGLQSRACAATLLGRGRQGPVPRGRPDPEGPLVSPGLHQQQKGLGSGPFAPGLQAPAGGQHPPCGRTPTAPSGCDSVGLGGQGQARTQGLRPLPAQHHSTTSVPRATGAETSREAVERVPRRKQRGDKAPGRQSSPRQVEERRH